MPSHVVRLNVQILCLKRSSVDAAMDFIQEAIYTGKQYLQESNVYRIDQINSPSTIVSSVALAFHLFSVLHLAPAKSATGKLTLSTKALLLTGDLCALALTLVDALELLADLTRDCSAGSRDGSRVAEVGVDAGKVGLDVSSAETLDGDVAGTLGGVVGA